MAPQLLIQADVFIVGYYKVATPATDDPSRCSTDAEKNSAIGQIRALARNRP